MNNKIIIGIVVIVLVVAGIFVISSKKTKTDAQSVPILQNVSINTITISNFSFSPNTLTVKQGTKVTWINQDSTVHTIKSDVFNSSDLNKGDTFEFTFNQKGTFNYSCGIHPSMTGIIVVQ